MHPKISHAQMICPFEDSNNNAETGRVFRGSSPKKVKHSSLWLVNVYHLLVSAEIFAYILHYSSPNDLKTCFWSNHLWVVATLQWHRETQQVVHGRLGRLAIFIPHTQAHKTTHVFISYICVSACDVMQWHALSCEVTCREVMQCMYICVFCKLCVVSPSFFNDCFMFFGNLGGKMMTPQLTNHQGVDKIAKFCATGGHWSSIESIGSQTQGSPPWLEVS